MDKLRDFQMERILIHLREGDEVKRKKEKIK
jgi:hypothetical protein